MIAIAGTEFLVKKVSLKITLRRDAEIQPALMRQLRLPVTK
jgi:hypothetical protein